MDTISLDKCFGCGKDNPIGLHLNITYIENKSHIEFEVSDHHCGYPGLMHGGLIGLLFDEAMFYAIKKIGIITVTVAMTIEYISPGLVGHLLICEAEIVNHDGKKIDVVADIKDVNNGKLIAKARGKYLEVDMDKLIVAD